MPAYTLMILIGCAVSFAVALARSPKKGLRADDTLFFIAFLVLGALIGAKILYLLIDIPVIYANHDFYFASAANAATLITSGFVFYGGLIGGFFGGVCYAKFFHVNTVAIADNFVPSIPLFHSFGRIGCFLAGCCYGIPYTGRFAVTYTEALSDANGISRFPVQLVEAAVNLILFFLLLALGKKLKKPLQSFGLYLILYGAARFILEFFRGDELRGFLGPLSTSQWISLILLPFGLYLFLCKSENNVIAQNLFNGKLPGSKESGSRYEGSKINGFSPEDNK